MHLIGHRGARAEAPENSLPGFEHLRNLGINKVEFDLRLSADNEIVIIHDEDLERTSDHEGEVIELRYAELKAIDCTTKFKGKFDSQSHRCVPSLREVLEDWPNLEHAQLEVKPPREEHYQTIINGIQNTCTELNLQEQCVITSSDYNFLAYCRESLPSFQTGLVFYDQDFPTAKTGLEACSKLKCNYLCVYWELCTEKLVNEAHDAGLIVSCWTVNDPEVAKKLAGYGVDSIITDKPTLLKESI